MFGNKTYPIDKIRSIDRGLIRTSGRLSLPFFILGFLLGIFGFLDTFTSFREELWLLAGLMLIGGLGSVFLGGKPQYFIRLTGCEGEPWTYTSYNRVETEAILKALKTAISQRDP